MKQIDACVGMCSGTTLFNRDDVIALRSQYGVDKLLAILTGWLRLTGGVNCLFLKRLSWMPSICSGYFFSSYKNYYLIPPNVIRQENVVR
jgi:hypothetical protein